MARFSDGELRAATVQMHDLLRRSMLVQAVSLVARLGIADLLDESAQTADELAKATSVHAPTLYRLLRALAGLGLFVEDAQGRFDLTPLGASLRSGEGSAREAAAFFGEPFVWAAWGNLRHSVTTGEPAFRYTHGVSLFEYARDLDADSAFHAFMTSQSRLQVSAVLAAYDFSRFREVVDVGGGQGAFLAAILGANPQISGVLYDLPEVVDDQKPALAARLSGRCRVVGGSFFDSVPEGADCYVLKLVIHDWDDEHAAEILRNVRSAIAPDGKALILEFVVPPGNDYHHAKFMDLNMLVLAEGGRERTEAEYVELLGAAGFTLTTVVSTASPLSILECAPI